MALAESKIAPHEILIVTGIGCGSKLPHYMKVTGYHTLHGRTVAVATGARLANHCLQVLTVHGDGDGYGEGLSHFLNAARRNLNIVDVVQDNRIYGLTKGQYSPTSEQGKRTPTSPAGSIDGPVQPLAMAITAGATFVSRGYSNELKHLAWLIGEALKHPGYALVDVLQPCVTFNRSYAYDFYNERVYKLEEEEGYDPTDRIAAWEKAQEWGERIPLGIFYRADPPVPSYEEQVPALRDSCLVDQPMDQAWIRRVEEAKRELM
jgi:2-oxoglutarate ferredoxin oxidoreductase subunit beta